MGNVNHSKADPIQIARATFDEAAEAQRVIMVQAEMAIEISADDGDSVITQSAMEVHVLEAGATVDTSKMKRMSCYPAAIVKVVIGEVEHNLATVGSTPVEVCAPMVKVMTACTVVVQS
jgi:hypothetical protein